MVCGVSEKLLWEPEVHARLTLVRHGQSEWNLANRFTGWVDVDLTERGITEARAAGRLLAADGQQHDLVVTSFLRRAIRTSCLVLSGTDQCWLPMTKDARLNEQHSGFLTGSNKRSLAKQHGVEQVMKWRRTFDSPPPLLPEEHPMQAALQADERYRDLAKEIPRTESLKDTVERVQACWDDTIAPALRQGKNVLVVSHGNTLRALVKIVDNVSDEDSFHLDLPTACPVVYDLDARLEPVSAPEGFWGASNAPRYGRFLMSEKKVRQAQEAMRQQCTKDIAVSTVSANPDADPDAIATCDAWTADLESDQIVTIKGQSFAIRERPPSYFALESERIKLEAQQEISSMLTYLYKERQQGGASGDGEDAAAEASGGGAGGSAPKGDGSAGRAGRAGQAGADRVDPPPTQPKSMLIILRHGYSEYNAENRFTGWADVELSNVGREEARFAGSLLREAGVRRLERVYSSYLKRAIKTAWLMLDELELQWVPISYNWRLNERHYGALQGRPKKQCSEEFGVRQVQQWRRGVHHPPPEWDVELAASTVDRRYDGIEVPKTESLADCTARLRPFLDDELFPAMKQSMAEAAAEEARRQEEEVVVEEGAGGEARGQPRGVPAFVIASSENLIRALVAELEGLPEEDIPLLDIPYATPLVYHFDEEMAPILAPLAAQPLRYGYYLGDQERIAEVQRDIRDAVLCDPNDDGPCDVPLEGDEDEDTCFMVNTDNEVVWTCNEDEDAGSAPPARDGATSRTG